MKRSSLGVFPRDAARWGLAALLLLPPAVLADPAGNDPVTLRLKFKAGEVNTYQTTMQYTADLPNTPRTPAGRSPQGAQAPGSNGAGLSVPLNFTQQMKVLKA